MTFMLEFMPILAALRKHRTAAILVALEIALSCAILCNAVFMIIDRLSGMQLVSGLAEDELISLSISAFRGEGKEADAIVQEQVATLRALPGVKSADAFSALPLSHDDWNVGVSLLANDEKAQVQANELFGSADIVKTMGLKLVEGREFTPEDVDGTVSFLPKAAVAILPRAMANKLWPNESALGKTFYLGSRAYRVIGVVEHLLSASIRSPAEAEFTALFPVRADGDNGGSYLLRVAPDDRQRILREAVDALLKVSPGGVINQQSTFSDIRKDYFRQDAAMAQLLIGVCVLMLLVTALGIVGLASFWVQSRTRQIGVRRALGARRVDILRYFQIENFLIVSGGIVLGMGLAYGLNLWLMQRYELAHLPFVYLPVGALVLWLTGQLAVLGPALRAAQVPPVVATRSV